MVNGLFKGEYDPKAADKPNLPSYIPSRNFALAILGLLVPDNGAPSSMASFREAIGKIENIQVKNALAAMLSAAGEDVEKFRGSGCNLNKRLAWVVVLRSPRDRSGLFRGVAERN